MHYIDLKEKHKKEINDFPMIFALNKSQLKEGMKRLGLGESDKDKLHSVGQGTLAYCKKSDSKALYELFSNQRKEIEEAIDSDPIGTGFIYKAT